MGYDLPDKEKTVNHIEFLQHGDFLQGMVKKELKEKMGDDNFLRQILDMGD